MADQNLSLSQLRLLQEQIQAQQATQQALFQQPAQTGLLNQGQTLGQFFTDPTQAQSSALLQTGLGLLSADPRDPLTKQFSSAIQSGLGALNTARGEARTRRLQESQLQLQGLQQQFGRELQIGQLEATVGGREAQAASQELDRSLKERGINLQERAQNFREISALTKTKDPTFAEKELIKTTTKQFADLKGAEGDLRATFTKVKEFRDLIKEGKLDTGAFQAGIDIIPGVFTEQGELRQELDALAEKAARALLKAMGEIRPTDNDVIGAKRALFGVGKDEDVNVKLMDGLISSLEAQLGFIESADKHLAEQGDLRGFKPPRLFTSEGGISFTKE